MRGCSRSAWRAVVVPAVFLLGMGWASSASAQVTIERFEGPVIGNPRVVGMAGALSSVGEDAATHAVNPATLATRAPSARDSKLGFGLVLSSWDRIGRNRARLGVSEDVRADDVIFMQIQLSVQYQQYGFTFGATSEEFWIFDAPGEVDAQASDVVLNQTNGYLGWGVALDRSQWYVGGSLHLMSLELVGFGDQRSLFHDVVLGKLGLIWAPLDQPARAAIVIRTPGLAAGSGRGELPADVAQRYDFDRYTVPWQVRVGGSVMFGPRRYNTAHTYGVAGREVNHRTARKYWLVSTELVLTGPASGATTIPRHVREAATPGNGNLLPTLNAHLGVEHEVLDSWLVLRAGVYEEMSRTRRLDMRGHITGGAQVRVPFWPVDLALMAAFDWSPSFRNTGIGVGLWH